MPEFRQRLQDLKPNPLFIAGFVFLAAVFLYWPALKLPLLFDDLLHIRLVKELDYFSIWLPSKDFGFYRPLVFLPFLIVKDIFGRYPAPLLHGLTVAQHALNAALLALLVWRLWGRRSRALAAGLLLAAYPFAYQAVAFYGNNAYPSAAGLILLCLHTYLSSIIHHSPFTIHKRCLLPPFKIHNSQFTIHYFLPITFLLFLAGLLTHETIVLFGPLALLMHWSILEKPWPQSLTDLRSLILKLWPAFLFILLGAVYAVLYQFLPTGGGPGLDAGGNAPWPKILYLVQSAVYPLAWFAHRLPALSTNVIILGSLGLMLMLTLWSAHRPANRPALLMGWSWWALASLLIGLNLPTYYIEHGSRLLYLGGIGAVLLWAILLDRFWTMTKGGRLLWAAALIFIFLSSASFVRGRLAAFTAIASPVETVKQVMSGQPANEGIILINLPAWMSPARNSYATGVEYVTLMGSHLFAEELMEENLAAETQDTGLSVLATAIPELLSDPGYPYGIHNQANLEVIPGSWAAAGSHVFITRYLESGPQTSYTGRIGPQNELHPPTATFGPYILTGASAVSCGGDIVVLLTWLPNPDIIAANPAALSIFVQALDSDGRLIAQSDGPPLGLRPDRLLLPNGWQITDRRSIVTGQSQPAVVLLGVYDNLTGERYEAVDDQKRPLPDNALSLPVTGCG